MKFKGKMSRLKNHLNGKFLKPCLIIAASSISFMANATMFQAEDYTAYSDTTTENIGGAYRSESVDIETTGDVGGGYNVGWIEQGEWLVLGNLSIPSAGTYTFNLRVASTSEVVASLDLSAGTIPLGDVTIPNTGGWQSWQTVSFSVELTPGDYPLGIFAVTGGWNFNWLEVVADLVPTPTPTPRPTNTPTPTSKIEAEDYDEFYDLTAENIGGGYRTDAVDIEGTTDTGGGFNVGWIDASEWLRYRDVYFPQSGTYTINMRVASPSGATANLDLNSNAINLGQVPIPATGDWQVWQTASVTAYVEAGSYDLGVYASSAGWNLNWLEIHAGDVSPTPTPTIVPTPTPGLVWADEFDAINLNSWTFETGGHGWGNVELQDYTDQQNAFIQYDPQAGSNVLVIEARKEEGGECWNGGNCQFTSTRMNTENKHAFQYGRIEARLKLPRAQGVWPAFWTLGNSFSTVGWPQSGEIDIMEHAGANDITFCALHGPGYSGGTPMTGNLVHDTDISTVYRVYAVEWDAGGIRWYVDDINMYSATRAQVEQYGDWVFDQPFWILLNVAVGGSFGGTPDFDNFTTQRMYVDYVRVYQ